MMRRKTLVIMGILAIVLTVSLANLGLAAAKQKVVFWSFAANNVDEWKMREAEIEKKFGIDLAIELVAEQAFVQKLQASMMDGSGPDIIEWRIEQNQILSNDPKKCLVIPLDKYTSKSKVFKEVIKGRVAWCIYGGKVLGLPHDVHPVTLIYNDKVWNDVGVDMAKVETWDDFFAAAQKLRAAKKDTYALSYDQSGLAATMWMIWQQTGAQVLDKDGKPTFDNPAFKEFVQKWIGWIDLGVMSTWDWGNTGAQLANGTLASYTTPDWWIAQSNEAAKKFPMKIRPLPYYKKGGPRTSSWGGSFMAITKTAKPKPDFLYNVIEHMQYDREGIVGVRFPMTDMIPPIASVWDSPAFAKTDARFGVKLGQILIELAKEMPQMNSGDIFWDAVFTDFNTQFVDMAAKKISVDAGLKAAQAAAMKRYEASK